MQLLAALEDDGIEKKKKKKMKRVVKEDGHRLTELGKRVRPYAYEFN